MGQQRAIKRLAIAWVMSKTVTVAIFVLTVLSCSLLVYATYLDTGDYQAVNFHDALRGVEPGHDTTTWAFRVAVADLFLGIIFMVSSRG